MASEAITMGYTITHFILITLLRSHQDVAKTHDEKGATAVEYGLLVAFIAGVIILAVTALGLDVQGLFNDASLAFP